MLSPIVVLLPLETRRICAPIESVSNWVLTLYFNGFLALCIYRIFRNTRVETKTCLLCLFFTMLVPVVVLRLLQELPPWTVLCVWCNVRNDWVLRYYGMFFGCGIHEELSKAAILFWLVKRADKLLFPKTVAFYGLIAGLGFGIMEGVFDLLTTPYLQRIAAFSDHGWQIIDGLLRHASWTSIAGYFIAFAALYPKRQYSLWAAAILVPALMHAITNMTNEVTDWGVSVLCMVLLMTLTYWANRMRIQSSLPTPNLIT